MRHIFHFLVKLNYARLMSICMTRAAKGGGGGATGAIHPRPPV